MCLDRSIDHARPEKKKQKAKAKAKKAEKEDLSRTDRLR